MTASMTFNDNNNKKWSKVLLHIPHFSFRPEQVEVSSWSRSEPQGEMEFSHLCYLFLLLTAGHLIVVGHSTSNCSSSGIVYICRHQKTEGETGCDIDRLFNQTGTSCTSGGERILWEVDDDDGEAEKMITASVRIEILENKIKAMEFQVKELVMQREEQQQQQEQQKRLQTLFNSTASSLDHHSLPDEMDGSSNILHLHHQMNLTEFVKACVSLIQQSKTTAGIRHWRSIEDYFLDQNNIQVSFEYLKRIIKASYNNQRANVLPTILFINQLERTSQKLASFNTLLDSMEETGHFPGKEIFTVAFFAGRMFDLEHKIWTRFPIPVRHVSTLWRLNWFVRHGNESYPLHFADPINSPLEILTTMRGSSELLSHDDHDKDGGDGDEVENSNEAQAAEPFFDWHFISTKSWHWLKVIGAAGYVKVHAETMLLIRDINEQDPGQFELHMNDNLVTFSIFHNGRPIRSRLAFGKPFAFTVQNHGEPPAEFFVEESKTAPNSRIIDLFD